MKKEESNRARIAQAKETIKKKVTHNGDDSGIASMRLLRIQLKVIDTFAAILGVLGIGIEYYLTQILFYGDPKYSITSFYNILCYLNMVISLALSNIYEVACITYHYSLKDKILKIKLKNLEESNFKSMKSRFFLEVIICALISPPNVNLKWTGSMRGNTFVYHITDIIMILSLLRCYLILRLYVQYSKWTTFDSSKICVKYGANPDAVFALKSDLKDRPFVTISMIMTSLVIIYGIAMVQSEKGYSGSNTDIDQLTNAEWVTVITMATVGYGDFFPTTHFGRFFCLMSCISGMVLISALVVAMNRFSEFSKSQSQAYVSIQAKWREIEWIQSAANVIKAAFRAKRCEKYLRSFRAVLYLKKQIFVYKRKAREYIMMDITSAEMLNDLQKKLEDKLREASGVIMEIPSLKQRFEKLKTRQVEIDNKLSSILQQQKSISSSSMLSKHNK